jgi:hypothetical protein
MRDYTYLGGARFTINNIFRSLRFDVDRLDLSWSEDQKPEFTRGLRIVDNDESNTVKLIPLACFAREDPITLSKVLM